MDWLESWFYQVGVKLPNSFSITSLENILPFQMLTFQVFSLRNCISGSFFTPKPSPSDSESDALKYANSASRLRISIANVSTERLNLLASRLVLLSKLWEAKGEGYGVE